MISWKLAVIALILAAVVAAGSARMLFPGEARVRITTTTSLYATGLLEQLAGKFEKKYPEVRLEFVAAGTGAALKYAERGDSCAIIVHAPSLEKQYLERGVLETGMIFAYNYFVIIGPEADPAEVKGSGGAVEAFRRIYSAGESGKIVFISRGDLSGTHLKELEIWEKAGLDPAGGGWYREAAAGMEQTLIIASELSAYSLADTGTYLKLRSEGKLPALVVLYASPDDPDMINIYSAYAAKACSGDERRYVMLFLEFLRENQELIREFGESEYGQPLFYPAGERIEELEDMWGRLASGMEASRA